MTGIFVTDCDCAMRGRFRLETYPTDELAVAAAYRHWRRRLFDDDHRYWAVHGPSGHVIALADTPIGRLPPV